MAQVFKHGTIFVEILTTEIASLNTKVACTLSNVCIAHIINNTAHLNISTPCEILTDLLRVSTITGPEDCQSDYFVHIINDCSFRKCKDTN